MKIAELKSAPLKALGDLCSNILTQLFAEYSGCMKELIFYKSALDYCSRLQRKQCDYVFPVIADNGECSFDNLKDIFLSLSLDNAEHVVPNDFKLSGKQQGKIVFGKNGSGKTVYLRSIGAAMLFAQAGLPAPAEKAVMSCFDCVFTQFAEAERFVSGENNAGRFEKEVIELSSIIERLTQNSIVFLNETFQTTAYEEGAECLAGILNYISEMGARWIIVSHMHQIKRYLPESNISYCCTDDSYKIIEM